MHAPNQRTGTAVLLAAQACPWLQLCLLLSGRTICLLGLQEDFFNDLEKEVNAWSKKRAASGQPASLWEELSAIGEEFVDFLEQGLGDEYKSSSKGKDGSSSGGSTEFNHAGSKARTPMDKYEELKRQYDLYDESFKKGTAGGTSGSSSSNGTGR